jgi:hypothetical protein
MTNKPHQIYRIFVRPPLAVGALLYRIAAGKKTVFSLPNRSKVRSKLEPIALEVDLKRCEKNQSRFDRVRRAFGIYFARIPHSIRIVLEPDSNIYLTMTETRALQGM